VDDCFDVDVCLVLVGAGSWLNGVSVACIKGKEVSYEVQKVRKTSKGNRSRPGEWARSPLDHHELGQSGKQGKYKLLSR